MDESNTSRLWLMRAGYVAFCLLVMFLHLLPLETMPVRWPGPDLLIAVTFAWALRRPDYVPALAIAGVMLMADLLLQRPPGLYAALVVIGAEQLKRRASGLRDASFAGEWAAAGIVVIAVALLNRLVLAILLVDQAPLALTALQALMTVAAYPLIVLLSHAVLGVRPAAPGDGGGQGPARMARR
jgi:rod shape-determining protein MreD